MATAFTLTKLAGALEVSVITRHIMALDSMIIMSGSRFWCVSCAIICFRCANCESSMMDSVGLLLLYYHGRVMVSPLGPSLMMSDNARDLLMTKKAWPHWWETLKWTNAVQHIRLLHDRRESHYLNHDALYVTFSSGPQVLFWGSWLLPKTCELVLSHHSIVA